jgi:nitrite reductase (NADH) large subunit
MIERFIIIGNGAAGVVAAQRLRENNSNAEILIVTESERPAYHRPKLIDYLAGNADFESLKMKKDSFYEENKIDVQYGTKIIEIDYENKAAVTEDGTRLEYSALLVACGAHSFIPPFKNAGVKGVHSLRTVTDADAIISESGEGKKAIVLGGGLLGLETANSLLARGCSVEVVEMFDYLLPRQLDRAGAEVLQKVLEQKGLKFHLGVSAGSIEGDSHLAGVNLSSGDFLSADFAVVSAGIRSNLELAANSGIAYDRGIVVDNHLQTNLPGVYAAGDCCQHNSIVYGQIAPAWDQARAAADNMCGKHVEYPGTRFEARLKVTGLPLYSTGDFNVEDGENLVKSGDGFYYKVVIKEDKLVGAIALGDNKVVNLFAAVSAGRKDLSEVRQFFA